MNHSGTRKAFAGAVVVAMALFVCEARAEEKEPAVEQSALARMPVKEVTVFKDGHAFVLHEGVMPTDADGDVVMDYLPAPVMGTFWPYSSDAKAKLVSVVSGTRKVTTRRAASNVRELIEANPGADIVVNENGLKYPAKIVGPLAPGNAIVLLKTDEGTKAVLLDRIQDVTFKNPPEPMLGREEPKNLLTLHLDWAKKKPEKTAAVGLMYVQRGIRWIPNYRIEIDGKGKATVKLQAMLINEMTDIEGAAVHLVIGVPTFAFKDTVDPIALQQTVAQLSPYFQQNSQTAYAFSNAIMSQSARMSEYRAQPTQPPAANLGPEVAGGAKSEDLFVFTVGPITLRKGERMAIPVAEYVLDYKDVYALDLPFAPPLEVRRSFNTQQQAELARLFHAPKVVHKVRILNKSKFPLTTAPALIFDGGRIMAQGMMTYTAIGSSTDLEITAAIDVQVKRSDEETKRTPNAEAWDGHKYARIDLAGSISLTNHLGKPIDLEISRQLLGNIDTVDNDGTKEQANALGDDNWFVYADYPYWWSWYNWPYWWGRFNGICRANWKLTLEPGKSAELKYTWHYFWPY